MSSKNINENQNVWNAIALSFDKTRKKPWIECINFINSLKKDCIIADIGCGNGRHLIPCISRFKRIFGIDFSKNMLNVIKNKISITNLKYINLVQSDVTNLSIKSNSFDAIIFIATLHNIKLREQRIRSLSEIRRILKKDGLALISVWSRWQDKYFFIFLKKIFKKSKKCEFGDINIYWKQNGLNIPRYYHLYSYKEFFNDLKRSRFEIMKIYNSKMNSKILPDNYFALVKK